ncbi:ankyrin, partial [Massarina eburnea CBS 473.64]
MDIIKMLLENGADANTSNNKGETPLHISLRIGRDYTCARKLISMGADATREDKDARTPLHSFFNDAISYFLRLHREYIDADAQDTRGMTMSHWACWTSKSVPEEIAWAFTSSTSTTLDVHGKSFLHFAVERGNIALVQYLLSSPQISEMSASDFEGRTLLHYATASGRAVQMMDTIMRHMRIDVQATDNHGR